MALRPRSTPTGAPAKQTLSPVHALELPWYAELMRRPTPSGDWPRAWSEAFAYDLQEVFGEFSHLGYAYSYANRRKRALDLVLRFLAPGATILDLAAAQGNFSIALAEAGYRVTWNDLRDELVPYVRLKHDRGSLEYAPGSIFDIDFPVPFDGVFATEIIEHVAHPDRFLERIAGIVRPGGYLILTTPNGAYFRNTLPRFSDCADPSVFEADQFKPNADGHIFLLYPDELRKLGEAAGLELLKLELFNNPLTSGHLKLEAALRMLPRRIVDAMERMPLPARLMVQMAAVFRRR